MANGTDTGNVPTLGAVLAAKRADMRRTMGQRADKQTRKNMDRIMGKARGRLR